MNFIWDMFGLRCLWSEGEVSIRQFNVQVCLLGYRSWAGDNGFRIRYQQQLKIKGVDGSTNKSIRVRRK